MFFTMIREENERRTRGERERVKERERERERGSMYLREKKRERGDCICSRVCVRAYVCCKEKEREGRREKEMQWRE